MAGCCRAPQCAADLDAAPRLRDLGPVQVVAPGGGEVRGTGPTAALIGLQLRMLPLGVPGRIEPESARGRDSSGRFPQGRPHTGRRRPADRTPRADNPEELLCPATASSFPAPLLLAAVVVLATGSLTATAGRPLLARQTRGGRPARAHGPVRDPVYGSRLGTFYPTPAIIVQGNYPAGGGYSPLGTPVTEHVALRSDVGPANHHGAGPDLQSRL